jgi:hypothetical protein
LESKEFFNTVKNSIHQFFDENKGASGIIMGYLGKNKKNRNERF